MEKVSILPLAITEIDETNVCVCGPTLQGVWIRPEPLYTNDLNAFFEYGSFSEFMVTDSTSAEQRPEDRDLVRNFPIKIIKKLEQNEFKNIIDNNLDASVDLAMADQRSAGILKVSVIDIHYGRTLGGKKNIRIIFKDLSGIKHNFIVADRDFKRIVLSSLNQLGEFTCEIKNKLLNFLGEEIFFTISLTKAIKEYPGPFRGCHALIAGVHTFPDYKKKYLKGGE